MHDETTVMRETLFAIRAELDNRRIPLKVCAAKGGIGLSTFMSWFPAPGGGREPQVPSLACLPKLAKALPGDLLSLLVPDGFHIIPDPIGGLDYDDIAEGCLAYAAEHAKARSPHGPGGTEIVECEEKALNVAYLPLCGKVAA